MMIEPRIETQTKEFTALTELTTCWKILQQTAVVDDDYPMSRHEYERALTNFITACKDNGRLRAKVEGPVSFANLRAANMQRLPLFTNRHGDRAHSKADGSDWSPAQWLQAVVGELGEYANLRKKHERGDVDAVEFHVEARKELADIIIYLDILAFQLNIDLGEAVRDKFNEVSQRVGCPEVKL